MCQKDAADPWDGARTTLVGSRCTTSKFKGTRVYCDKLPVADAWHASRQPNLSLGWSLSAKAPLAYLHR